ncbi:MAG: tail fiber domain-containing protein, partial [Bacteroidales bacterium]|nr:tail fiber domain-containing protein [Bacteroidales bacterium]
VDQDHNFAFGMNGQEAKISASEACFAFGPNCTIEQNKYSAVIGNNLISGSLANAQFVCGRFNKEVGSNNTTTFPLFIVGNGTRPTETARSNAFEVYTTGNATLAGTLTQSSDSRLKNNVTNIGSALENVVKLRGVTFNWDLTKQPSADKKLQYGFIAQEVEKVFPELVTTDSKGFKTLNYIGVIPVLTEAVKELKQENDELKSTIQDLIKRIEALEKK